MITFTWLGDGLADLAGEVNDGKHHRIHWSNTQCDLQPVPRVL